MRPLAAAARPDPTAAAREPQDAVASCLLQASKRRRHIHVAGVLKSASPSAGTPRGRRFRRFPLPGPVRVPCGTPGPPAGRSRPRQAAPERPLPAAPTQLAGSGRQSGPQRLLPILSLAPAFSPRPPEIAPFKIAASPPALRGLWLPTDVTRADGPVSVSCCGVFKNAVGVRSFPPPPF